jgi:hypothetical protein
MRVVLDFDKVVSERVEKPRDTQYTNNYLKYIKQSWSDYEKLMARRLNKVKKESTKEECRHEIIRSNTMITNIEQIISCY